MGAQAFGIDIATVDRIAADVKEAVRRGHAALHGGRRRQHLPRPGGRGQGHRPRHRRLYGHAGHRDERAGHAGGAGARGRRRRRVQSAIPMSTVCEPYIRRRAIRHMEKGRVVIFAAGTGNPFFTTDTAAALRAAEMNCDAMLKAPRWTASTAPIPRRSPDAERYDSLSYHEVLARDLQSDGCIGRQPVARKPHSRSSCSRSTIGARWPRS